MSIAITQSPEAAFPDRPEREGIGLLVDMAEGCDGGFVRHDLQHDCNVLHVRVMVNPNNVTGGQLTVIELVDRIDRRILRLKYLPDSRRVELDCPLAATIATTLLHSLNWHCIELQVDKLDGRIKLWVNGIDLASEETAGELPFTGTVRLGAMYKDRMTSGQIFLDEWIIADQYIGPVIVKPKSDYADDPARWLVIYNTSEPDSVTWAQTYRDLRNVPYANLIGLDLAGDEVISLQQYDELVTATNEYLAFNNLYEQVMGVLIGYRVPGYVDTDSQGRLDPVPALMYRDYNSPGPYINTNAGDHIPARPTYNTLNGDRLTARIDAPDLQAALELIYRAGNIINKDAGDGEDCHIYIDSCISPAPIYQPITDMINNWVDSIDRMKTRLPVDTCRDNTDYQDNDFDRIDNDAFLWSVSMQPAPPLQLFSQPAGRRIVSVQLHLAANAAGTLRNIPPSNWIDVPLYHGYAAAIASARAYSPSAVPYPRPFFHALKQHWTLAEAWYLAQPVLREGLYLVGDPLLTADFPKEGWNLFGPIDRLEELQPDQPAMALRSDQLAIKLPDQLKCTENQVAYYLVRRVDQLGRSEASLQTVRTATINGQSHNVPLPPAWPDQPGWNIKVEDNNAVFTIIWPHQIRFADVDRIELLGITNGGNEFTVQTHNVESHSHFLIVQCTLPTELTRYRWRIISPSGVVIHSPWSASIIAASTMKYDLQLLETLT